MAENEKNNGKMKENGMAKGIKWGTKDLKDKIEEVISVTIVSRLP